MCKLGNEMGEQAISTEYEEKLNEPMTTYSLQKFYTLLLVLLPISLSNFAHFIPKITIYSSC
jgi:hypothetical protein